MNNCDNNIEYRIIPFRGIRYNHKKVKDLDKVICPPYDVITPQQREAYYNKSEHNIIRLEYTARNNEDAIKGKIYERAANTFQQWMANEVLFRDVDAAFYLHDYYFDNQGVKSKRRELIARVKLEPWYKNIYPHENTFPEAKSDRLSLMQACQVSFSSILVLYDSGKKLATILSRATESKPIIELSGSNEHHIVWAINENKLVNRISELLAPKPLFIADGHHRYETALTYQSECLNSLSSSERGEDVPGSNGREAFNYIMMNLVDFSDPGLLMSPIHRLVRGIEPSVLDKMREQLEKFFIVESVPITDMTLGSLKQNMPGEVSMAVLGLESQLITLLKEKQDDSIKSMMPENHTIAYNNLGTNLFNYIVLDKVLGIAKESDDIAYIADVDEAYQKIKEGAYQLAFLLTAPETESIKDVSFARERMPHKSTYFHPKLPTGLIINPLF